MESLDVFTFGALNAFIQTFKKHHKKNKNLKIWMTARPVDLQAAHIHHEIILYKW